MDRWVAWLAFVNKGELRGRVPFKNTIDISEFLEVLLRQVASLLISGPLSHKQHHLGSPLGYKEWEQRGP